MKILVILPTYNEQENLARLVAEIFALAITDLEILIIDDNSPDGTGQLADQLAQRYPIKVIHRVKKLGLGTAYQAGFAYALANGFGIAFQMDADFSHEPQRISDFIKGVNSGYDLVIGSRRIVGGKIVGWSAWRYFTSSSANYFSRWLLGLKTKDATTGFRAYSVKALQALPLGKIKSNGYAFQEETIFWAEKLKLHIKEIPIIFKDRQKGRSKLGLKVILEFFVIIFKLISKK
ncbi:MAG: polyprenol monophosphomannose synthase [Candidatus Buchananbacteria bacterium]